MTDTTAVRAYHTFAQSLRIEAGQVLDRPVARAAAAAVITNPFAGRYVASLQPLIDASTELSATLSAMAVGALGAAPESYGKAAIIGTAGELEHAAALLHPAFGEALRAAVGGGRAIIPSAKKRAGPGATIDVPLHHKDAAFVRSHFDAIEVRVTDAPAPDEIVLIVAVAAGGRPLARVGGLTADAVAGTDGLR
jgi:hypothetical protein